MTLRFALLAAVQTLAWGQLAGQTAAIRDSAGVRIVVNPRAGVDRSLYRLGGAPLVDVGGLSNDAHEELLGIIGATRLSSGNIMVGLGARRTQLEELRLFDARGRYVRTIGRIGDGPGEFRDLAQLIRLRGDTILAYDASTRLSYFDSAGKFIRSEPFTRNLTGRFGDGSFLVQRGYVSPKSLPGSRAALYGRDSIRLVHVKGEAVIDSGRPFFNGDWGVLDGVPLIHVLFGAEVQTAVDAAQFYFAVGPHFEIGAYSPAARLTRSIRVDMPVVPLTAADFEKGLKADLVGATPAGEKRARDAYARIGHASTFPAFSALRLDASHRLWASLYAQSGEKTVRWLVFAAEGQLLGSVTMPVGLQLFEIGTDYVLGTYKDSDDEPHVVEYRLVPGGR